MDCSHATKSLSPLSGCVIDAKIIREGRCVYLEKKDESGGIHRNIIEKDQEFYDFLTQRKASEQIPSVAVMLYISSRCQMNCPVCYESSENPEMSRQEIKELIKRYKGHTICLCGREPTCREDLPQIIKLISKNNNSLLMTNGLKLADYEYCLKLKRSGLKGVVFSFDGFDDRIFEVTDGRGYLSEKLKALDNLKRLKINTVLSVTICPGVNDTEIDKLFNYCCENRSFISQLRLRSVSPVGRHLNVEARCPSEMLDLVVRELDIDKDHVIKELEFWSVFYREVPWCPENLKNNNMPKLCSFFFHVKRCQKKNIALGQRINIKRIMRSRIKIFWLCYYLFRLYGIRYMIEGVCNTYGFRKIGINKTVLPVVIKCWPNAHNIDLNENNKCTSLYYKNGKMQPFCYYNIIEGIYAQDNPESRENEGHS
ncbi:MAG: radical SAM protein [Candidatus Omnitrophota bacterium]